MRASSWLIALALAGCGGEHAAFDAGLEPDAALDAGASRDRLSQTGLYGSDGEIADGVRAFAPTYVLWSDGAVKSRWLYLPPGTSIDTTDPAHWQLPVGAKLWKLFAAPDGRKLETRLIERVAATGSDDVDYWAGSFAWLEDESDAVFAPDGVEDARGTDHDIPAATVCRTCHTGEPGFMLGVSTLQLSGPGTGVRLDDLAADGVLGPAPPAAYEVPGDATTRTALGSLHANCGHCHNRNGAAWPDVSMVLQLDLTAGTAAETTIWQDTVGVALTRFVHPGYALRIAPGDPDASALVYRMSVRDPTTETSDQMPPLATEHVDDTGVAAVRAWITTL